jgi:DNA-binding GntR family transcriptional regulator
MAAPKRTNGSPGGVVDEIVDGLRTRIIRGELEPGQRLWEETLAAEFGVSRIPLREALRALTSEGFLRSEYYGGTFVARLDEDAAHDLLDVRAVLEPLAAAQAAVRCAPDHLETFYELLAEGERALRERRYEDTVELKVRFSEHLAVASQNTTLISVMRTVRHKIEWASSIEAMKSVPEEKRKARAQIMREIIDAIANRDPDRAARGATANIDAVYSNLGWSRLVEVRARGAVEARS